MVIIGQEGLFYQMQKKESCFMKNELYEDIYFDRLSKDVGYVHEDNFSFHTMELYAKISRGDQRYIYDRLNERYGVGIAIKKDWSYNHYMWVPNDYKGLRVKLVCPKEFVKDGYYSYSIRLIINPESLLRGVDAELDIFKVAANRIKRFNEVIADFVEKICRIPIKIFSISRIDYCFNAIFNNEEIADTYLKLLSRGDILRYNNCDEIYNHMKESAKTNMVEYKYSSFVLKAYNKRVQLEDIGKKLPNGINACIRFEIEIGAEKIRYIMKSNGFDGRDMFLFCSSAEAEREFYRYITFHFKRGVYLNMAKAKEYIAYCVERGYIKKSAAKNLTVFIEEVSQKRSIYIAGKEYTRPELIRMLKKLEEINLNPVTIPERWNGKGKAFEYLPSICTYLKEPANDRY